MFSSFLVQANWNRFLSIQIAFVKYLFICYAKYIYEVIVIGFLPIVVCIVGTINTGHSNNHKNDLLYHFGNFVSGGFLLYNLFAIRLSLSVV